MEVLRTDETNEIFYIVRDVEYRSRSDQGIQDMNGDNCFLGTGLIQANLTQYSYYSVIFLSISYLGNAGYEEEILNDVVFSIFFLILVSMF